jgi:hypothetical protein
MPMMSSLSKLKILADFDKSNGTYLDFSKNVSDLIEKILVASGISVTLLLGAAKSERALLVSCLGSINSIKELAM